MTTTKIEISLGRTAELTTDRAESSYGQPVLVVDGVAFGAADVMEVTGFEPLFGAQTAGKAVENYCYGNLTKLAKLPYEEYELFGKFLKMVGLEGVL